MEQLQPGATFGVYRLERKLGLGGMAEVWLARPLERGHRFAWVVLKRVYPHLTEQPKLLDLYFDEVRLAQRLEHPNVVAVFDSGRVGHDYYMAMEYVDGLDLRNCLQAHGGPLWPALAAALIAEACVGLEYAHTLKDESGAPLHLVHRDLAPDNLMVSTTGQVKLLDFGVARAADTQSTTRTGMRKGKLRYMAPEYVRDHVADARSDVYSLGATLFELCTGALPFEHHRSPPAVMNAIVREGLPRADALRPSLPGELVSAIAAATEREPSRRLPSARALEQRLRAFLREYVPPTPAEIGAEVARWRERLGGPVTPQQKRVAGSYGQLETTEFVPSFFFSRDPLDAEPPEPGPPSPPKVAVAHQLEPTEFALPVPSFVREGREIDEVPTEPGLPAQPPEPSVVLSPDLEDLAERKGPDKKRRR